MASAICNLNTWERKLAKIDLVERVELPTFNNLVSTYWCSTIDISDYVFNADS